MDPVRTRHLFEQTLLGDYEDEEPWAAISALRLDGSREIFDNAAAWCQADDPLKRARGAAILCQLQRARPPGAPSTPDWISRDESYELITQMLADERNTLALESAISALGHLGNSEAVSTILRYQSHSNPDVRLAVAFALGCFPDDPASVRGLLALTSDPRSAVRDWAVFGLGVQGHSDSPEIRDALLRCVSDPDSDVCEEAAVALGQRHDLRVLPRLRAMLDCPEITVRVAEAAAALLELEPAPADWTVAEYQSALRARFASEQRSRAAGPAARLNEGGGTCQ
ncbi:MAG: HEAT repeat domain-containing protein [Terriglobales bacterium]